MHAWIVEQWCEPDQMSWQEIHLPQPGARQVIISTAAVALNFLDTLMIRGQYQLQPALPFSPGVEISGTVVATGPESHFKTGDRVCGLIDYGGFAEQVLANDQQLVKIPDTIDFNTAAAIPVVYPTAWCTLRMRSTLKPGETVLVHAGAGGVGLATIQLAAHWGARVFATSSTAEKRQICIDNGAEAAFGYDQDWRTTLKELTAGKGVDVVVDNVGGSVTLESVRALAWGGRLAIVGFAGGEIAEIPANRLLLKNASAVGVMWGGYYHHQPEEVEPVFSGLFELLNQKVINPVIGATYPLTEAPKALKQLTNRKTHGKVLLLP